MRPLPALVIASVVAVTASCSLLLNYDDLQAGGSGGKDASVDGSGGATGGTAGSGGTSGGTGGASGSGATGGVAGSGGAAGADGAAGIPIDQLGHDLAAALCANLADCYGPIVEIITQGNDCQSYFQSRIEDSIIAPVQVSIADAGVTYSPTAGAACVAQLTTGCADPVQAIENCKSAFGNLKASGTSCSNSYECAKNFYCDLTAGCASATCKQLKKDNDPCTSAAECATGYTCYVAPAADAGGGTCQPYTPHGTNCDDKTPACVPGDFCVHKVCATVKTLFQIAEGSTCYSSNQLCVPGLACEFQGIPFLADGKCVQDVSKANCAVSIPDECGAGNYCDALLTTGNCKPLPGDGLACASALEVWIGIAPPCSPGNACVNKTCRKFAGLNQPCFGDAQCTSGYCAGGDPDAGTAQGTCQVPECP